MSEGGYYLSSLEGSERERERERETHTHTLVIIQF